MQFAIIIFSVIFGLTHLINIAGGAGIAETILQIFFALFFGIVCAEILIITGSILPIMLWHALHDFLVYTTNEGTKTFIITGAAIQTVILIAFGMYLFTVIRRHISVRSVLDREDDLNKRFLIMRFYKYSDSSNTQIFLLLIERYRFWKQLTNSFL